MIIGESFIVKMVFLANSFCLTYPIRDPPLLPFSLPTYLSSALN